jgi:membrane-bound lytic murein transglycosylase B
VTSASTKDQQPPRALRWLALGTLVLAMSVALSEPGMGQTAKPEGAPPAELIDPDCHPERARLVDPSLLEEPDGACPPGALLPPAPEPAPEPGPGSQPAPPAPGTPDPPRPPARPDQGTGGLGAPRPDRGGKPQRQKGNRREGRRKKRKSRELTGGTQAQPQPEASPERRRAKRREPDEAATLPVPEFGHALPGPTMPDFIERGTRVPRFLHPIYHSAGARYGIRWEILASINEIETDFGRNLNISWAGAMGWMQFMPATWRAYGTDGNKDGVEDPYDPTDAIFSAARYLSAAGYEQDVRGALFAYNHADWYVEDVLKRAREIAAENLSPPKARRLDARFASRLVRVSDRAGVPWELMLAVLRARGRSGSSPATRQQLRALARRLVRLGARKHPRRALYRLARAKPFDATLRPRLLPHEPSFVERAVALAHYNRAVGIAGLERGLKAVAPQLRRRVLNSRRLEIYPGGRADIENGVTSVRVLALLAYLASRYDQVGVTSLTTGHSQLTASGNVSAHSYGRAVDIASLNGTPVFGHQEAGGLTERALWNMLLLPDELASSELISLFELGGPSFALADHADHIHVGY